MCELNWKARHSDVFSEQPTLHLEELQAGASTLPLPECLQEHMVARG